MRPKKKRSHILLYDREGMCLETYVLIDYPLPEDTVRELSIRFFGDPEPCHIHRAAVLSRAMAELMESHSPGVMYPLCSLPEQQRRYFDLERFSSFAFQEGTAS